ncbi:sodium:solute symporter family protein [Candidatus Laterigemmans baculatus]|uniref:sodium:solute symporter family protein n=1 Tax=Candidatus Laterigemmans baculatus TaxID=2770505 RepID=UPI0013D9DE58|nr:sodium:solute symporter family protein [Candidatus Laterigemmans baculatus]
MHATSPLSETMLSVFAGALLLYLLAMYAIGYLAQRRIRNVEDFVLAGRRLPVSLATITIIATWFGAESLMTTADEVGNEGLRKAMLDPLGIALCLLLAGLFVAGPMWRMNLLTVPDFFFRRFGKRAEIVSSLILVPSYFGWVAAQFVALAQLLETFFGIPKEVGIGLVALFGTGYTLLGGMWTITWTDAVQIGFILLGLLILGWAVLVELGSGQPLSGVDRLWNDTAEERWRIADPETFWRDTLTALSALAIGALGNLPMQDLMQRIFSAGSDRIAAKACLWASGGYLLMGVLPVGTGMAAHLLLPEATGELEDVVMVVASGLLSPLLLLVFFLAIVSAVLSTIVSAVLAPSAVMAHNLVEPLLRRQLGRKPSEQSLLLLQRASILAVAIASAWLSYSGEGAYELVQGSYSMALVGLFVPFLVGLRTRRAPATAAILSMIFGIGLWSLHMLLGWEIFFEPWLEPRGVPLPHELAATVASGLGFVLGWGLAGSNPVEADPVELGR